VIVVGIDPGTANCGFAVLQADLNPTVLAVIDCGCFRSDVEALIATRLEELARDLKTLLDLNEPSLVVCETPGFVRDAGSSGKLWAAYGVLVGVCHARGTMISRQTPTAWRKQLGLTTGKITPAEKIALGTRQTSQAALKTLRKAQTADLLQERFPALPTLLGGYYANAREHAYDAMAIAIAWVSCAVVAPRQIGSPTLTIGR
jgi:Holliday junction resolvasome RuvABC endonuclease subunit